MHPTAATVINRLSAHFSGTLYCDNRPQFASAEFHQFSKQRKREHCTNTTLRQVDRKGRINSNRSKVNTHIEKGIKRRSISDGAAKHPTGYV